MSYDPYPTGTLLVPSGPGKHLFIVVTNKCASGQHLLLSVTSIRQGVSHDQACLFSGGEHEFIQHPSYVYYRLAEIKRAASISNLVEKNYYAVKDDLQPSAFEDVCKGVTKSKFIKRWAVDYFVANHP